MEHPGEKSSWCTLLLIYFEPYYFICTEILANILFPKMLPFVESTDPNQNLKNFCALMMINSGTNEVKCKLFIGTLTRVSLDWFSALPDNSITYFDKFSLVFVAQFVANKEWLALTINLFYVPQQLGKSLKGFHMRFNGVVVWVTNPDKRMVMATFCKGLRVRSFGESLVCLQSDTMTNVYLE